MKFQLEEKLTKAGFQDLCLKVEKINKKASRIGMEPLKMTFTSEICEETKRDAFRGKIKVKVERFTVTIEGKEPVFDGYEFFARIEHNRADDTASGYRNMVQKSPHVEIDLPFYRTTSPFCDHCNSKRYRKNTYIVREISTCKMLQVGSTCLKYYININMVKRLEHFFYSIDTICSGGDEEEFWSDGGGRVAPMIDAIDLLKLTSFAIRAYGWVSKGMAWNRDDVCATAGIVAHWAFPPRGDAAERSLQEELTNIENRIGDREPTEKDETLANEVLDWILNEVNPDENDYLNNLYCSVKTAASGTTKSYYVFYKDFGIACSAISAFSRAKERELEYQKKQAKFNESKHLGEIKKRQNWNLTVDKIRYLESEWGSTTMYTFVCEGSMVVYFSSRPLRNKEGDTILEGEKLTLKATVKAHKTYKGVKQTVVTRGVVQ